MATQEPLPPLYLVDGGLGTTLADLFSVSFDESKPLWSSQLLISDPETLKKAQTAFADSGADILLTVTYQASFEGFKRSGVGEQDAGKYMRDAVSIAKESFGRERRGKVGLTLGAYGATMVPGQEYTGRYDERHMAVEQLREWHLRRIEVFFTGGKGNSEVGRERKECWANVDLVAFETFPLLQEVEAARQVMGDVALSLGEEGEDEGKDFWICCVFPGEGNRLPDGSSVKEVVQAMLGKKEGSAIPMGIGLNCTKVSKVEGLVEEFEKAVAEMVESGKVDKWPSLVLYPDGTNGEVYNTSTKVWEKKERSTEISWDETLFKIVSRARERRLWKSIYVGGCCKTTPVEIGKLRRRIDG